MRSIAKGLPSLVDLGGIIAVVLISVGAGLVFFPAGLITAGVLLLVGTMLAARVEKPGKTRDELRAEVTR